MADGKEEAKLVTEKGREKRKVIARTRRWSYT